MEDHKGGDIQTNAALKEILRPWAIATGSAMAMGMSGGALYGFVKGQTRQYMLAGGRNMFLLAATFFGVRLAGLKVDPEATYLVSTLAGSLTGGMTFTAWAGPRMGATAALACGAMGFAGQLVADHLEEQRQAAREQRILEVRMQRSRAAGEAMAPPAAEYETGLGPSLAGALKPERYTSSAASSGRPLNEVPPPVAYLDAVTPAQKLEARVEWVRRNIDSIHEYRVPLSAFGRAGHIGSGGSDPGAAALDLTAAPADRMLPSWSPVNMLTTLGAEKQELQRIREVELLLARDEAARAAGETQRGTGETQREGHTQAADQR